MANCSINYTGRVRRNRLSGSFSGSPCGLSAGALAPPTVERWDCNWCNKIGRHLVRIESLQFQISQAFVYLCHISDTFRAEVCFSLGCSWDKYFFIYFIFCKQPVMWDTGFTSALDYFLIYVEKLYRGGGTFHWPLQAGSFGISMEMEAKH